MLSSKLKIRGYINILIAIAHLIGLIWAEQMFAITGIGYEIADIYLLRGIGELVFDLANQTASPMAETTYSLIAVAIGLLFLIGGWRKWGN